jgi:hypothetical protein
VVASPAVAGTRGRADAAGIGATALRQLARNYPRVVRADVGGGGGRRDPIGRGCTLELDRGLHVLGAVVYGGEQVAVQVDHERIVGRPSVGPGSGAVAE